MGIKLSTPFLKILTCNYDCKEEISLCIHPYIDADILRLEKDKLLNMKADLQNRLFCTTDALDDWIKEVENECSKIESILKQEHKNCCFCCYRYKFGYHVVQKRRIVDHLQGQQQTLVTDRMIVEKSEIELLKQRINDLLAKKADIEKMFPAEQLKEEVRTWIQEVYNQEQQGRVIMQGPNGAINTQLRGLVTQTVKIVDQLRVQREKWDNDYILVVRCPKESDIKLLRMGINNILASKKDLEKRDAENRSHHREFTEEVKKWIEEVDKQSQVGNAILDEAEANRGHDRQLGTRVEEMRGIIDMLQLQRSKWVDKNIVVEKPPSVVEKPCWYSPKLIGVELKVKEVIGYLTGDQFSIIKILGVSGIGKTALLEQINNALYNAGSDICFTMVIFVEVSQKWSISQIQKDIASRLGVLKDREFSESNTGEHAKAILKCLRAESFLLLLDDVWEDLDLGKIGIPQPTKLTDHHKIVITTRFENICSNIGIDKTIQMECLDEDKSWQLFYEAVGGEENEALQQPEKLKVALELVDLCGGLPRALIEVGRAVAGKETIEEWRKVEYRLVFDKLEDDAIKSCFLFCLLFPPHAIPPEDTLVEYWIGEGLLDENEYNILSTLKSEGGRIYSELVKACLLVEYYSAKFMLDVVYNTATEIETEKGEPKTLRIGYLREGEKLIHDQMKFAKRASIYLSFARIESLKLCCPCLKTLLIEDGASRHDRFPDDFFDQTRSLRVLDLSNCPIRRLPSSLCSLVGLRYLNLSNSKVEELPVGLGQLVNLLFLNLSCTKYLSNIPKDAVSCLVNLLSLDLGICRYDRLYADEGGQLSCHDLEGLHRLEELRLPVVESVEGLELLLGSAQSSKLIRSLELILPECNRAVFSFLQQLPNLETLYVVIFILAGPWDMAAIFVNLRHLSFIECRSEVDMTCLLCQLPNLVTLHVSRCERMQKLFYLPSEWASSAVDCLSKLKEMELSKLPELTSIADGHLAFDSLVQLKVEFCHNLRKLLFPFVERDQKVRIKCDPQWWEGLEWEDNGSKAMFVFEDS